ncbi:hypothetical protein [Microbispora sp. ATCC PTA-5024]|uniref:hypothetical protein n=1 Tax=Microbispora sp. ATCC PTA-5024 TaxID=316330 RepID=UPI000424F0EB|nr:hypothetical protein [Microbispora sp. ATCC PTA-5024]
MSSDELFILFGFAYQQLIAPVLMFVGLIASCLAVTAGFIMMLYGVRRVVWLRWTPRLQDEREEHDFVTDWLK